MSGNTTRCLCAALLALGLLATPARAAGPATGEPVLIPAPNDAVQQPRRDLEYERLQREERERQRQKQLEREHDRRLLDDRRQELREQRDRREMDAREREERREKRDERERRERGTP